MPKVINRHLEAIKVKSRIGVVKYRNAAWSSQGNKYTSVFARCIEARSIVPRNNDANFSSSIWNCTVTRNRVHSHSIQRSYSRSRIIYIFHDNPIWTDSLFFSLSPFFILRTQIYYYATLLLSVIYRGIAFSRVENLQRNQSLIFFFLIRRQ